MPICVIFQRDVNAHMPSVIQAMEDEATITTGERGVSAAKLMLSLIPVVLGKSSQFVRELGKLFETSKDEC